MTVGTLTIRGRRFVVIPEDEYNKQLGESGQLAADAADEKGLPPFPPADAAGNRPAIEFSRVSLARKVIIGRRAAGWSQAELARHAGIRAETVNRIEKAKNTPDPRTFDKLTQALKKVGVAI